MEEMAMHSDPIVQFSCWFREAQEKDHGHPEAVALATAGRDGIPSARIVLLKQVDEKGFVFFTNYTSRKAIQLQENPFAALVAYWPQINKQVRIEGKVYKISPAESHTYFQTRPRESQLSAWTSKQSSILPSQETLESRFQRFTRHFAGHPIPCPPFWGGFRLVPSRIEFWIGKENRLHERFLYTRTNHDWSIQRLYP